MLLFGRGFFFFFSVSWHHSTLLQTHWAKKLSIVICFCLCFKMFLKWHLALSLKMFMLWLAPALSRWYQEKAQWIRVNESYTATDALADRCRWLAVFSARSFFYEYCRRWYSPAYRSTMLTACVFVTRDMVRHPRRFVFGKFVRKPNCSWSEAFVNRGLTVILHNLSLCL